MNAKIIREAEAIYAALADKETLKRAPIFVDIDGTEAVLISLERYQELTGQTSAPDRVAEQLAPLKPEMEAYRKMLPDLLKEHRGQWVAIHQGQIVEISADRAGMTHRLLKQDIYPLYIQKIQEGPRIVEMPSVEIITK